MHKRYCAALGEMVLGAIPKGIKPARIESLESIEPLPCEDGCNVYSGQLGRARRVKKLQAQLGIAEH
ncbi:hypothetical protein GCM10027040_25160 [Halomonas shantousis]